MEESVGDGEAEDGVSDKLELFVVGGGVEEGFGLGFVGERTMGERPGEEFGALETMIEENWGRGDGRGTTRGRLVRVRSSVFFVTRRNRTSLRSNLPDGPLLWR
jgi:hypothetical protein